MIHQAEAGVEGRSICVGLGSGDHSRAALLARRVMMAGEAVVLSSVGDGEEDREADYVSAFLGLPLGSSSTRFRGCLCVMDTSAREWTSEQMLALRDLGAIMERDLGRRPLAEEHYALETVVRMLAKAVENMQLGVTITDMSGRIVYTNPAEARMHGYQVDELLGCNARVLGPPEHIRALDESTRESAASWTRETVNVRRDGSRFEVLLWSDLVKDAAGTAIGMVTCCEDITDRKRAENSLRDVAMRDSLTSLPNRAHFQQQLASAIERQRVSPASRFAVLFLDLDRFKVINDSLGHHVGDELLRVVASRLLSCVRPPDTVARFGGDEFAVLLDDIGAGELALRVAERILKALASPIELSGYELVTSASIGIVQSAAHMSQTEYIWQAADMAMYRAKANGTARYEVFDREMHLEAMSRLQMETDLRRALEKGEFRLEYQPVVDLAFGRAVGFEALLRWDHPERGEVQPAEFIEVAEETGLIVRLGEWVLGEACREARRWQEHAGKRRLWVGVNLSARQLAQPQLPERVREALAQAGIAPDLLKLEITEAAVMHGADLAADGLRRLKEAGVQLFLDDFGTGYSSLSYLHRLPIDVVKIDRSFIGGMKAGDRQSRLVEGVVRLARSADLRVIAEGVSDADQLDVLARLGCDMAQGYLFAPALEPEMIQGYLEIE
jgi:diguanylate cyclase (GGDEF)-like protein/PAS domain S-box-containing protein